MALKAGWSDKHSDDIPGESSPGFSSRGQASVPLDFTNGDLDESADALRRRQRLTADVSEEERRAILAQAAERAARFSDELERQMERRDHDNGIHQKIVNHNCSTHRQTQ